LASNWHLLRSPAIWQTEVEYELLSGEDGLSSHRPLERHGFIEQVSVQESGVRMVIYFRSFLERGEGQRNRLQ
jgi:hypothetical protein